jgi:hypothetical protein
MLLHEAAPDCESVGSLGLLMGVVEASSIGPPIPRPVPWRWHGNSRTSRSWWRGRLGRSRGNARRGYRATCRRLIEWHGVVHFRGTIFVDFRSALRRGDPHLLHRRSRICGESKIGDLRRLDAHTSDRGPLRRGRRGGHFAALEQPEILVGEIRTGLRTPFVPDANGQAQKGTRIARPRGPALRQAREADLAPNWGRTNEFGHRRLGRRSVRPPRHEYRVLAKTADLLVLVLNEQT